MNVRILMSGQRMKSKVQKSIKMDYLNLSKEVSYALRHAPWEYELELDSEGWVSVEQLISSFRNSDEKQNTLSEDDLVKMIDLSENKI